MRQTIVIGIWMALSMAVLTACGNTTKSNLLQEVT